MEIKNFAEKKILFMGTPDFAVGALREIIKYFNVVSVVTSPDKPSGRGQKMSKSAVKIFAEHNNINVLQPLNLKSNDFVSLLGEIDLDLIIVVAFRMLPKEIWKLPKFGTINLHASLLPQYRGAAPINWAIINGEKKTGITTFFIDENIDCGKIIKYKEIIIESQDNAEILHNKLMNSGANLLIETITDIFNSSINEISQEQLINEANLLKSAPKIFKNDCKIDWNKNANEIYDFIRGLSPYPTAWTEFISDNNCINLKIYKSEVIHNYVSEKLINTDNKTYLHIKTTDNKAISIIVLQPSSRKKMQIGEFLRGNNFDLNKYLIL